MAPNKINFTPNGNIDDEFGAVERRYRLRCERAVIDADQAASAAPEDHRRIFAAAMATLLAEFNTYRDRENAYPAVDLVG
ncbi:hypothetical protein [Nocardia sp. NPDC004604]|uniref:hypothetical protein n=1 Tax=Nocardia sp. NPDC004604 TaxID=3157013 RepID=UPI0033B4B6FA